MKNRTLIGILCIILSVTIMFGISPIINKVSTGEITVIQVKNKIATGETITEKDIIKVKTSKLGTKDGLITNEKDIIGKQANTDIYSGVNIYPEMIGEKKSTPEDIINSLDGQTQAISITVKTFADGLSGKLQNGDIVSLIITKNDVSNIPEQLTYVKVITTTSAKGQDLEEIAPNEDGSLELPATVTLLVNKEQAKLLALYDETAKIRLALIYRGNEETADKFLESQNKFFEKVGEK